MRDILLSKIEIEALYNCINYTYDGLVSDMSLSIDEEDHDQLVVMKSLISRLNMIIEDEEIV